MTPSSICFGTITTFKSKKNKKKIKNHADDLLIVGPERSIVWKLVDIIKPPTALQVPANSAFRFSKRNLNIRKIVDFGRIMQDSRKVHRRETQFTEFFLQFELKLLVPFCLIWQCINVKKASLIENTNQKLCLPDNQAGPLPGDNHLPDCAANQGHPRAPTHGSHRAHLVGGTCLMRLWVNLSKAVCPPEASARHPWAPGVGKGCNAPGIKRNKR